MLFAEVVGVREEGDAEIGCFFGVIGARVGDDSVALANQVSESDYADLKLGEGIGGGGGAICVVFDGETGWAASMFVIRRGRMWWPRWYSRRRGGEEVRRQDGGSGDGGERVDGVEWREERENMMLRL
ncbi:hypothetical protein V2J09_002971 [Rumex salicifolius]